MGLMIEIRKHHILGNTKNGLMMKSTLGMIVVLAVISTIGIASAYTAKISEMYNTDIYLYNCEKFYIVNDDHLPHTVTEQNKVFDTTILWPNQMTDVEIPCTQADYVYYDNTNPSKVGALYVRPTDIPATTLAVIPKQIQAGESVTVLGNYYPNTQTVITITKPDATTSTLSLTPTQEGRIETLIQTTRTFPNGIYSVSDEVNGLIAQFSVSGGVTEDNPIEESPVVDNSTSTLPEPQIVEEEDTPTSPAPVQQNNSTIPTNSTNTKQAAIDFVKSQIKSLEDQLNVWKQLLSLLEAI